MSRHVHIVAVAARAPVGFTAESSAAAVRAGISRVRAHPFMVDAAGDEVRCGHDAVLDPALLVPGRLTALAGAAISELAAKLTMHGAWPTPVTTLLTLPERRPGFGEHDERSVELALSRVALPGALEIRLECFAGGHAGALRGLEIGMLRVNQGSDELFIIGGVDSYLDPATIDWLDKDLRLAREAVRSGFSPGEGAAMVAVANDAARTRLGLPSLARVRIVASDIERRDPNGNEGLMGEAMSAVLARAGTALRGGELLADVFCDINGERSRTDDWGFALLRAGALMRDGTSYKTSVGQLGDLGAASAAFNCVLATQAWRRKYAKGATALVWGASWTGLRCAAILDEGVD